MRIDVREQNFSQGSKMKKPVLDQSTETFPEITEGDEVLEFYEFEDEEYVRDEIDCPEDSFASFKTRTLQP